MSSFLKATSLSSFPPARQFRGRQGIVDLFFFLSFFLKKGGGGIELRSNPDLKSSNGAEWNERRGGG